MNTYVKLACDSKVKSLLRFSVWNSQKIWSSHRNVCETIFQQTCQIHQSLSNEITLTQRKDKVFLIFHLATVTRSDFFLNDDLLFEKNRACIN